MTTTIPSVDIDETVIDDQYDDEDQALADAYENAHHVLELTASERDDLGLALDAAVAANWY